MATRRIIPTEKTFLDQDDPAKPSQDGGRRSDITPAVPTDVIFKLLGFTFAMIVCPIGSYFATVDTIFKGRQCFPLFPVCFSFTGQCFPFTFGRLVLWKLYQPPDADQYEKQPVRKLNFCRGTRSRHGQRCANRVCHRCNEGGPG